MCSNAFSTKGSLKVHMRLHTGAKPFKCPHCELRFRTSGRRKTHMQFHYKPDPKKARKPATRAAAEGPQPVSAPPAPSTDSGVFIMNSPVLTGQLDQSLLQPGLLGQAVLPASVSGGPRVREARVEARATHALCPPSRSSTLPSLRFSQEAVGRWNSIFQTCYLSVSHSLYHPFCILVSCLVCWA